MEEIDEKINQDLGDVKHIDIKKEDEDGLITIKSLVENAKIPNNDFNWCPKTQANWAIFMATRNTTPA